MVRASLVPLSRAILYFTALNLNVLPKVSDKDLEGLSSIMTSLALFELSPLSRARFELGRDRARARFDLHVIELKL